ncbi:DNA polymerase III subunit gamma/tau [Bathymodiolus japonicus methanotrophic gill symbiont]|uniref:DNA polymerase III subunit gamma/tau n=1 Tax=Bathymodiolus japonicus methanotrophic gill symbiont TaxID=113269 RepID=UPI001B44BE63|nr:DNA polymerase III subunit gamma/tau [Bathymodiolus japonicus methanotrophic gill symbiont]GFO72031.1 DNA polymerase III subunit gamma/tau [Bathymodiolus japonicus methanotrophic gill symbiont]
MNHQVLARKWRPHNFNQIVGQEHVSQALINALQHDRLHHAYLFTGTRGVGKTTIARILAKAVNCENLQDYNPCGQCSVCQAIDEGRYLDLIEVDAASQTGVDNTRDLLDNAQYAPNAGKYKVYLIDEVHMLSLSSFNALLKTLEEPPEHVKFLLATTDPQKIPVTVLSRCLQFNLKRLTPSQISEQMAYILGEEKIQCEQDALRLIARAADGSMRDGLSLLDQAIVFGNDVVSTETVSQMLGTIAQQPVAELLRSLALKDASKVLQTIQEMAELSPDFADVLQQILRVLHRLALVQLVPAVAETEDDAEMLRELSELFSAEELQLYYQIALMGQKDLGLAPEPRAGFEMMMLRMLAFNPQVSDQKQAGNITTTTAIRSKPLAVSVPSKVAEPQTVRKAMPEVSAPPEVPQAIEPSTSLPWHDMVDAMNLTGLTRELANNCILESVDAQQCCLILDPKQAQIRSSRSEDKLQAALQKQYGNTLKLVIKTEAIASDTPAVKNHKAKLNRQQAAVDAIDNDENIQALKSNFDARVISGSIEPVENIIEEK